MQPREKLFQIDALFWGALAALCVAAIQSYLARPLLEDASLVTTAPAAMRRMSVMLWLSVLVSPITFLASAIAIGTIVWSVGALLDQPAGYRRALAAAAWAEIVFVLGTLVILVLARLGLLPETIPMAVLLGVRIQRGAGLVSAVTAAAASPVYILWVLSIGVLLARRLHWTGWAVILSCASAFALRIFIAALRATYTGMQA